MIVGHKIERYLTGFRRDYGLSWEITHHQVITELHATKGWRTVSHERKRHVVKELPPKDQWRAAAVTVFVRKNPKKERADFEFPSEEAKTRSLMRHRERRRDIRREQNYARHLAYGESRA